MVSPTSDRLEKRKRMFQSSKSGNTIAEYGFIGALLLVFCMGSWILLGGSMNQLLGEVKKDMQGKRATAIGVNAYLSKGSAMGGSLGALKPSELRLLQESMSQKAQTAGANGAIVALAKQLSTVAKKLLAEGKISEAQFQQLLELSSQGHKMAAFQTLITDALNACNGNVDVCQGKLLHYNGNEYNFDDVYRSLGFNVSSVPGNFLSEEFIGTATPGGELRAFLIRYQEAVDSGALNSPEAKSTVDSASVQIVMMSDAFQNAISKFTEGQLKLENKAEVNQEISKNLKDKEVHQEAGKICNAGDFSDDGVTCTK